MTSESYPFKKFESFVAWNFLFLKQGLVASYWNNENKRRVKATLISPMMTEEGAKCFVIHFRVQGTPAILIMDMEQNNTKLWNFRPMDNTFGAYFRLGDGIHRLQIVASLSFGDKVIMSNVSRGDDQECAGKHSSLS